MQKELEKTVPEQAYEIGRNYFKQGLNCTECVMRSFMDLKDIGYNDDIIALATGFGGGMGHTKNTCGAITGAVMALSSVVGRKNPLALESVGERIRELDDIYAVVGRMVEEIEAEYGTLICKELSDPMGDFEGRTRKKGCMSIIGYCSQIAMKYALAVEGAEKMEGADATEAE